MPEFRKNYGFLDTFFRDVIAERTERCWLIGTLYDGDVLLRDAHALVVLTRHMRERCDVSVLYVRAFGADPNASPGPGVDLIILGRPKPYSGSILARFGRRLEGQAVGKWNDPSNGTTGSSVHYGDVSFSRHELPTPGEQWWRRCDRDVGVLLFRGQFDENDMYRRMVSISGLSTFGTDCLTQVLCDERHREKLLEQVRDLAPWQNGMRPEESFEICVEFWVDNEDKLTNFLNKPDFNFRVVAVAVAGAKPFVRPPGDLAFELVPAPCDGGSVHRLGYGAVELSPMRFNAVRYLVEHPGWQPASELATAIYGAKGADDLGPLAKLICDTNKALRELCGHENSRLIISNKKKRTVAEDEGKYAIRGMWSVRGARLHGFDLTADPQR
jgi:hypothetical protein